MSWYIEKEQSVIKGFHKDFYIFYKRFFNGRERILDIGCSLGNFLHFVQID